MNKIKSLLFNIFLILWTLIITLISTIFIIIDKNTSLIIARFWAKIVLYSLKLICGIDIKIIGKHNIPKEGNIIIVSKHQSALETIAYLTILDDPIFILKKELTKIPLYGRFLKKMQAIEIDRSTGASALKTIIRKVKELSKLNRPFIIFPEGTRSFIGEKLIYQPGIAALYDLKIAHIIPVAINTGLYWSKDGGKKPGTCIIEFLPAINQNLSREDFMKNLQSTIENRSDQLLEIDDFIAK